jgi:hypothetical protein
MPTTNQRTTTSLSFVDLHVLQKSTPSLVKEHWQLVLLLAFNLVMMDMNAIFTSFLLVQTSAGCEYHSEGGAYVQSQTVSLVAVLLWRPFSSLLTDWLPKHNHWLLVGAVGLELAALLGMLLLVAATPAHALNPWWVLGLSVFKQCTEVQLNNSVYKIFKMRLQQRCGLTTCASQCHVVSAVGIVGELIELVFNLGTCLTAYWLMRSGASFASVKYVYFGMTLFATMFCGGLGISIASNAASFYSKQANDNDIMTMHTRGLSSSSSSSSSSFIVRPDDKEEAVEEFHGSIVHNGNNNNDRVSLLQLPLLTETVGAASLTAAPPSTTFNLCRSLRGVVSVPVALGSMIVMCVLYISQEVLYNVESLAIPGTNKLFNVTASSSNFCAQYLINTVYQDVWENTFYTIGTLFYIGVLKRTSPLVFFQRMLPIGMVVLVVVSAIITMPNMSQLALALAMESVVAFEYFFFLYAKFLSIAAISSEFYGVYSFLVGSMKSIVDLLIYAAMECGVATTTFHGIMFVSMGTTVLFALGFSVVRRRDLIEKE